MKNALKDLSDFFATKWSADRKRMKVHFRRKISELAKKLPENHKHLPMKWIGNLHSGELIKITMNSLTQNVDFVNLAKEKTVFISSSIYV